MTTPVSLKEKSFFGLPSAKSSSLLKDDMVQKKLEVVKVKAATKNGGSVDYKSTTDYKFDETKENQHSFNMSDELKLGLPYRGFYSQFRIDRRGNMRLHYDLGSQKIVKEQNFYAQAKFTDKFDKFWLRFGSNFYSTSGKCQSHQRLERNFAGDYQLSYKNIVRLPSFVFGAAAIFNLSTLKLQRYNASFQYTHNQFEFGLAHDTPKDTKDEKAALAANGLGRVTTGLHYKHDDKTNFALQVRKIFSKNKPVTFNLGVQHAVCKDMTARVKVNQDAKITVSGKYKLDSTMTISAATQLPLRREGGPINQKGLLPLPFGYQIDVNL